MEDIIVIDKETGKEFKLIKYDTHEDKCTIHNKEYGYCSQYKHLLELQKFTTNIQHISLK